MSVDPLRHAAKNDLHLLVQQLVIEHDLQGRTGFDARIGKLDQFHFLVLKLARQHLSRIRICIDLLHAAPQQIACFIHLYTRGAAAERVTSNARHFDHTKPHVTKSRIHIGRAHHERADAERTRRQALTIKLVFDQGWRKERVVDFLGEVFDFFRDVVVFFGVGLGLATCGGGVYRSDIIHKVPK